MFWSKWIPTIALLAPTAKQSELLGILSALAAEQVQLVPPVQSLIEKAAKYQETHIDRLKSAAFFAFVTGMFRT